MRNGDTLQQRNMTGVTMEVAEVHVSHGAVFSRAACGREARPGGEHTADRNCASCAQLSWQQTQETQHAQE